VGRERYLDRPVGEALTRREREDTEFIAVKGPMVAAAFPVAGATLQVAHGLGAVPDGHLLIMATGAVYDVQVERWSADLAYLTAPVANTYARMIFFRLREPYTGA